MSIPLKKTKQSRVKSLALAPDMYAAVEAVVSEEGWCTSEERTG